MSTPSLDRLIQAARKIVKVAIDENVLHTLTLKSVRKEVEQRFDLEDGTLDDREYKKPLNQATQAAINEFGSSSDKNEDYVEPYPKGKGKATSLLASKKREHKDAFNDGQGASDVEAKAEGIKLRKSSRGNSAKMVDSESVDDVHIEAADDSEGEQQKKSSRPQTAPTSRAAASAKRPRIDSEGDDERMESPVDGEGGEASEQAVKPKQKRAKTTLEKAPAKKPTTKSTSRRRSSDQQQQQKEYKTPEHVPTSDMEEDEPDEPRKSTLSKTSRNDAGPVAAKRRKKAIVSDDDASGNDREPTPKPSPRKVKPSSPKKGPKILTKVEDSETELSDLIDEPVKSKKPKAPSKQTKDKPAPRKRAGKAKAVDLSKDEKEIKRLKSFVVACGVRKAWWRLFEGMSERQQILELKKMLAELGMTGKLSMERARQIKEKREMEEEIKDVVEFEKKVLTRNKRSSRTPGEESDGEGEEHKSDEDEEEVAVPKRRTNARNSIAAFLQDQSSDEG